MHHPPTPATQSAERRNLVLFLCLSVLIVGGAVAFVWLQKPSEGFRVRPSPQEALEGMALPDGFRVTLFAAEPMLANPVALCVDGRQRFYIVETSCFHYATLDYPDEQLACRTWEESEALRQQRL